MLKRIALASALSMISLVAPSQAGLKEGIAALERGDFAAAIREFTPLAERNRAAAQFYLGVMYANGYGVPQDDAEAVKWYRLGARGDDPRAQYGLGVMFAEGKGGLKRDYARAVDWYHLAAAQGLARAMNDMAVMYEYGLGTPRDLGKAYAWYDLAAASFGPGPEGDRSVSNRQSIVQRLTPQQLARAQDLAKHWSEGGIGATVDTPSSRPRPQASTRPPVSASLVAAVQIALAAAGYDPGPADGTMGARTRAAIRAFQTAHKRPVTGEISAELLSQITNASAR